MCYPEGMGSSPKDFGSQSPLDTSIDDESLSEVQSFSKEWISANCCDGDDRSEAENDRLVFSAPDLYELINDLVVDLEKRFTIN